MASNQQHPVQESVVEQFLAGHRPQQVEPAPRLLAQEVPTAMIGIGPLQPRPHIGHALGRDVVEIAQELAAEIPVRGHADHADGTIYADGEGDLWHPCPFGWVVTRRRPFSIDQQLATPLPIPCLPACFVSRPPFLLLGAASRAWSARLAIAWAAAGGLTGILAAMRPW